MKLMVFSMAAVLSVAYLGPAFAKDVSAEQQAMQQEAMSAGKTDEARAAYWNTMKAERQAAWTTHCTTPSSDDTAEIQAMCKVVHK